MTSESSSPTLHPENELAALRTRCAELEQANERLTHINESLMDRVERDTDRQGNSFTLIQAATALESKVNERTAALHHAMHTLEETNRELLRSNQAAQAANRAKSAFLAAMSHELRTPMNGVIGMTELLLNTELNSMQRKFTDTIRRSALALLSILNDILDFSKIEAGQLQLEAVPFELCKATQQSLDLLLPQSHKKGLELRTEYAADLPHLVVGDPTRLMQIVNNLVGNAIKFTEHGHIVLRVQVRELMADSVKLYFEIEDTGLGIKPDAIPRLFNSFTQADSSTTRKFGGTGLGLAIVRRLCNLMGGECGVRSDYGKGSCFWFTLTLRRNLQPEAHVATGAFATLSKRPAEPAGKQTLEVLLVDDNPINQEVAAAFLEVFNCVCSMVDNGLLAVATLTQPHHFDLVLMDCQMPEMDGYEATRRIRSFERDQDQDQHVPIIALTANAMVGDREQCLACGMDDYLSKPFQLHELAEILAKWCPRYTPSGDDPQPELGA